MKKKFFFLLIILSLFLKAKQPVFAYPYPIIPPVEVPEDLKRASPYGETVLSNESKTPKYYSNDIENTANQFICPITFEIAQTYDPTPILDENGQIIDWVRYDVTAIRENQELKKMSNYNFRNSSVYYGLHPYTNLYPTPNQENKNFTKLNQNGYGVAYRSTSIDQQFYLKGKFIEDVILSIGQQKDTPVIDEQLAWDCAGICKNLFNNDGSQPSGCRAVHVSEVACFFNNKINQSTSYKWENGKPVRIPFPYMNLLAGCNASLPQKCYETLYNDLPFIPRGTVNTKLIIENLVNKAPKPTPYDRGFPLMAPIDSDQMAYVAKTGMKTDQKVNQTSQSSICNDLEKNIKESIVDKPSPLSFEAFSIEYYKYGTIYDTSQTFTETLNAKVILPKSFIRNIDLDKALIKNLIPASASAEFESKKIKESSTADESIVLPDPGYKDDQLREDFKKWFTPVEWQKKSQ